MADADPLLTPSPEWKPSDLRSGCSSLPHRLIAICDISADKCGSIELVQHITSIDHPFLLYDHKTNTSRER